MTQLARPGFDLDSLLRFTPPEYLCARCYAVLAASPDVRVGRCPVCNVHYQPTHEFPRADEYLAYKGLRVEFSDLIAHGTKMATIARQARESLTVAGAEVPPMRVLLDALAAAEQFIHFTTYGISALLLGAVKLASARVPVRGVISGIKSEGLQRELTQHPNEAPNFQISLFDTARANGWFPHQKIIVIDGLIAFKGSANLTDFAWRKAAQGGEVIEVVTDLREIADLHNRFFSAAWAAYADVRPGEQIMMSTF